MQTFAGFLIALLLMCSATALASQDAFVKNEDAPIRERPMNEAKIIESLPNTSRIRVSNNSKNGWYKVRTQTGQFGWISQNDVVMAVNNPDFKAADLDMKAPPRTREARQEARYFIKAGATVLVFTSSGSTNGGVGVFGEFARRVWDRTRVGLRLATLSANAGTPLLVGIDTDLIRAEEFDLTGGLHAGLSISNRTGAAALANFSARYAMSGLVSLVSELGYYIGPVSGPMLSAGIMFRF